MKKVAKLTSVLICLALAISLLASVTTAAPAKYTKIPVTSSQLEVGMYTNTALTGDIVNISANPNYEQEITCLIDKKLNGGYWSKAMKFNDLKDNGGSNVPVIKLDMTKDGKPTNVAAVEISIRHYFDCMPLHFEVQAITEANGSNWVSVFEQDDILWMSQTIRFDFPGGNVAAYQLRILFYDIAEPNIEEDTGTYETLAGDETRFALAEIALYSLPEGSTPEPTTPPTEKPTEPTSKPTEPAETDPAVTDPAETDPAVTDPAETDPNATDPAETDPNATDPAETDPVETDPVETDPVETDPAETDPVETDPKETDPKETEPEATNKPTEAPSDNKDAKEEPKNNAGLIIGIVAAVVIAAAVVFFVIKKKRG